MDYQSKSFTLLVGRVGKDPKITTFNDGNKQATISVATTDKYKDKAGEYKEIIEWHSVVCNGSLAAFVEKYVTKGDLVAVEGKNRTRSYEKSGTKHYITEVQCSSLTTLSSKKREQDSSTASVGDETPQDAHSKDGLPF